MGPFGASPGGIDDLASQGLKNELNNIPQNDIETLIDADRVQPRQVASGVQRGTQRIVSTDGSYITLGEIPDTDGEFGIAFFDSTGQMVFKLTGTTQSIYSSGNERTRLDELGLTTIRSDGTYANRVGQAGSDDRDGIWTAKPTQDLNTLLGG
jgi:hypothetical protein